MRRLRKMKVSHFGGRIEGSALLCAVLPQVLMASRVRLPWSAYPVHLVHTLPSFIPTFLFLCFQECFLVCACLQLYGLEIQPIAYV